MATRTSYLGAPEPFNPSSGNDWTLYSERFENFLLANEINDEQKLHLLLALVSAQTFQVLTNVLAEVNLELKKALKLAQGMEAAEKKSKPIPVLIHRSTRCLNTRRHSVIDV